MSLMQILIMSIQLMHVHTQLEQPDHHQSTSKLLKPTALRRKIEQVAQLSELII